MKLSPPRLKKKEFW